MNTVDIRSTNSTQGDFWAVCGPISVVISIIALTIGCRKQIAHTALYQWVKARAVFLISRIPRIPAILTTVIYICLPSPGIYPIEKKKKGEKRART